MNRDFKESFIMDVLECGCADVEMLEYCYSHLAEEVVDVVDVLKDLSMNGLQLSLNYILEEVYTRVKESIVDTAIEQLNNEQDLFVNITENDIPTLCDMLNKIKETNVYCNYIDTGFDSDIDQTIDWDLSVRENAMMLVSYEISELKE